MAVAARRGVPNSGFSKSELWLGLLDGFELKCNGRAISLPLTAQRLLAFVALQDRPVHREHVAGVLWGNMTAERAAANLRSTLWRLRRPGYPVVEANVDQLRISSDLVVDVRTVTLLAREVIESPLSEASFAQISMAGELLPDWYDDWILAERERFHQLRLLALEALCERLTAHGNHWQAVAAGLGAVAGEPLRESANRALIAAHLAQGNRFEAIRQYRTYKRLLREELGIKPSRRMDELLAGMTS